MQLPGIVQLEELHMDLASVSKILEKPGCLKALFTFYFYPLPYTISIPALYDQLLLQYQRVECYLKYEFLACSVILSY